jgi:ribosomal protein S18 acetylase RimI-like enzyme
MVPPVELTQEELAQLRQAACEPINAQAPDRADVVALLSRAFMDDANLIWTLRTGPGFTAAITRLFDQLAGQITLPMGHTYLARVDSFGPVAVAAWQPPEEAAKKFTLLETLLLLPDMVRVCGLSRLPRMIALIEALEQHHPTNEPHFYLSMLGVDPRFQGRGLGSRILEASLVPVDAQGLPSYLENSKPRNTPLYARYGFRAGEEFRTRPDAPPLLPMWRPRRAEML